MKNYPIKRMLGFNGLLLFLLLAVVLISSGNVNADPTLGNRPHSNTEVRIENSLDGGWGERLPATGTSEVEANYTHNRLYDWQITIIRFLTLTMYFNSYEININEKPNLSNNHERQGY